MAGPRPDEYTFNARTYLSPLSVPAPFIHQTKPERRAENLDRPAENSSQQNL